MLQVDPSNIARRYQAELKEAVARLPGVPRIRGFIATEDKPSIAYANATRKAFTGAGFEYDLRQVKRLELEKEIVSANEDPDVHGIFIYFPVFGSQEDSYLRNIVSHTKDVEAGSLYWTRKMSANDRHATIEDDPRKALLPCTPLAVIKILDELGEYGDGAQPLAARIVTIFNRSEVIGRPLAVMMSNDGATVYSFDEHGPLRFDGGNPLETAITREDALKTSDIVITGVPSTRFQRVAPAEVSADAICINFSSVENFEPGMENHARIFVPRVGPMTVAMCMRNTIRLYENFHVEQ